MDARSEFPMLARIADRPLWERSAGECARVLAEVDRLRGEFAQLQRLFHVAVSEAAAERSVRRELQTVVADAWGRPDCVVDPAAAKAALERSVEFDAL